MKRTSIILMALATAAAFGFWKQGALVAETHGKLSTALVQTLQEEPSQVDILVRLTEQADLSEAENIKNREERLQFVYDRLVQTARRSQKNVIRALRRRSVSYERMYIINMLLVRNATPELIETLAARKDVAKIYGSTNVMMQPPLFPMDSQLLGLETETNIQAVGADKVWKELGITGAGIVVAGQDTGVQWDHPSLIRQYRGQQKEGVVHNYSWYDAIQKPVTGGSSCGYASATPCDDHAHGTHTLGTAVGHDGGDNAIGVAPDAEWIACRNMDAGTGRPHTYIKCFEFFLAPHATDKDGMTDGRPELAPHVINNSWGCPKEELCEGDVLLDILRTMKAAGIFVVVSAGNSGPSCSTIDDTPAWHSADTFAVGAYNHRNNKIAGFSSRGPSKFDGAVGPDVAAPGVSVRSAIPGGGYEGGMWSGTSMAGPHVAGLVALMWSANPDLIGQIDETISLIQSTADPELSDACMSGDSTAVPNNTFGYGRINAYKAVKAAIATR